MAEETPDADWAAGLDRQRVVALGGAAARRYADLISVSQDLDFVIRCCEQLAALSPGPNQPEPIPTLLEALWTAALVGYSRAFSSGKRLGLSGEMFDALPPEALEVHKFFRDMRDKRLAHSVNPFEQVQTLVTFHPDAEAVDGVGYVTMRHIGPGEGGPQALVNLALVLKSAVHGLLSGAEAEVRAEAAALGMAALRALPEQQVVAPRPSDAGRARD